VTRDEALQAYYADALVMARMGYAPKSERWKTVKGEQVLVVGYVVAPDETPAVLEALAQADAHAPAATPLPATLPGPVIDRPVAKAPTPRVPVVLSVSLPLEARLALGALGGLVVGVVACVMIAAAASESADVVSLAISGFIGLLVGALAGLTLD